MIAGGGSPYNWQSPVTIIAGSLSFDWERQKELSDRYQKSREHFDAMIAPAMARARPRYPKRRQQRQPEMKYFGIRGFHG